MRRDEQFDLGRTQFERNLGYNPEFLKRARERRRNAPRPSPKLNIPLIRESVEQWKRDMAVRNMAAPTWVKDIIADCAARHGLEIASVLMKNRPGPVCRCRHEIMYLLRINERKPSWERIAGWLDLNHATIVHGYRKHIERMAQETE